jgi:glycosyltransferase involved in cell wall biosynthesis
MRIALLTSAKGWRGSAASYAKLAQGLQDRGHVAHLVTATSKVADRLVGEGLEVTRIPGRIPGPRAVAALHRTLAKIGAQAIVADTPRDVRLSFYATLARRARIIYRYNVDSRRLPIHFMDRFYLRRVAACVYQSSYVHDYAVEKAAWMKRLPSYHIPNGYDTDRFAPHPEAARAFRERYGIPAAARVVLTAARLTRGKGHDIAIAALNRLRHQGLDLTYVVCGDGALEGELVSIARRVGLPTVFTGLLPTRDMIGAYGAADLVVHPSLREIFPNAVGEAMACGRPVIAADAGGTAELLGRDGTTGVLVPPSDAEALGDAVGRVFADPARLQALGAAARRRIQERFPIEHMVAGYERALVEVIGDSG